MLTDATIEAINAAIQRLSYLTGEDFHGYRSEVWGVLTQLIKATASVEVQPVQADWSQAPEWASWWCIGSDMKEHWYQNKPFWKVDNSYGAYWTNSVMDSGKWCRKELIDLPLGIDWRTTLRKRPEAEAGA